MFSGRVLATFPLALLTLAACGDSGEEPEEARPYAESSLDQISEDAETAMREAGSFRVTGTDTRDGDRLSVDLRISGEECRGTIGIAGEGSFRLIHVGGVSYFKADEEFWTSQAGDRASARAAMEMIGDRWAFDSTDPNGFGELCDVDTFVDSVNAPMFANPGSKVTGPAKVAGVDTVGITFRVEKGVQGRAYVAVAAPHHVLKVVEKGRTQLVFRDIDEPVDVRRPAGGRTFDLGSL